MMSRARKLCEELNKCVSEEGRAYLIHTFSNGLRVTSNIEKNEMVILGIYDVVTEDIVLDHILMLWEDEMECFCEKKVPRYLWKIRDKLWGDYNVN